MSTEWNTGLCACFSDFPVLLQAWCLPCIFIPKWRSDLDGSNCCFNFLCLTPSTFVHIARTGYGIGGNWCIEDCILPRFCLCLQTSRAGRQIKAGGPLKQPQEGSAEWSNPLTGCFSDFMGLIASCCFPGTVISCALAEKKNSPCLFNFCCMPYPVQRQLIRQEYGIGDSCAMDILWGCCPGISNLDEVRVGGQVRKFTIDTALIMGKK